MLATIRLKLYSLREKKGSKMNNENDNTNKPDKSNETLPQIKGIADFLNRIATDENFLSKIDLYINFKRYETEQHWEVNKKDVDQYWKLERRKFYVYSALSAVALGAVVCLGILHILSSETIAVLISVIVSYLYGSAKDINKIKGDE